MARPLTLLLVRHGQSEWNAAGLMQGQTHSPRLTELGHRQAADAARDLAAAAPGALVSSDLRRAVETAEHCARATGLTVRTTPALREQSYGVLEGRPSRELWDVVALVTHGDTIRAAQAVAAGVGPEAMPAVTPHNGTVTRLELAR